MLWRRWFQDRWVEKSLSSLNWYDCRTKNHANANLQPLSRDGNLGSQHRQERHRWDQRANERSLARSPCDREWSLHQTYPDDNETAITKILALVNHRGVQQLSDFLEGADFSLDNLAITHTLSDKRRGPSSTGWILRLFVVYWGVESHC